MTATAAAQDAPIEITRPIALTVGDSVDIAIAINDANPIAAVLEAGALPDGVELVDARLVGTAQTAGDSKAQVVSTDTVTGEQERHTFVISIAERPLTDAEIQAAARANLILENAKARAERITASAAARAEPFEVSNPARAERIKARVAARAEAIVDDAIARAERIIERAANRAGR